MVSVDVRTRTAADVRPVDAVRFFDHELPALIAERSELAVPGARELHPRPIAFVVDDQAWTMSLHDDQLTVSPGGDADAEAVVRLDAEGFADLINDLRTAMAFFVGGELDMAKGRLEDFLDWSVILRSLVDGRPVHTTGTIDFRDRDGSPLDLHRAFSIDDDPAELAHFLAEAGFLHVAGVFGEAEMKAVSEEMDAAMPHYSPGDGRSWWAKTADGTNRLVRLQYFHEHSPTMKAILGDDRLQRLARLTGDGHRLGKPGPNNNLVEALVKPVGIVEGISDVPWHKDCSLGSHSYRCCSMTVGISVTGADADSGQLRVVAGSHRALIQPAFVRHRLDLPQLELPTRTGDVTVHLSCTLHMAQPPVTRERRVMYTDFSLPDRDGGFAPGEDTLRRIRERAPTNVSQPPGYTATFEQ
ncbi:MAG: hypothetical protein QOD38_1761 [Acidimicrobiaceae bacterium]